ncbi:MAG TPA: HAD hydrolase-like protein [Actinomycetota bacterium]|nr:HAD hydrolase-like protein [Actinomycetota bacterium]
MVVFDDVEVALLDLDGTVYVGTRPVPGAGEAVERLRRDGLAVRFTSNTDSTSPAALAARLAGMGIPAAEDDFLTPVVLARRLFDDLPAARVLAIASPAVREHLPRLQDLGGPGGRPTHVLLCDPSYGATYDDLDAAFRAVRDGAELVATQLGRVARRDDGEHLDTGGWVRLLEYATGVRARVLGKPSPEFFRLALELVGGTPDRALVVGDDRAADVGGARTIGARSVLVRTGKGARPPGGGDGDGPEPDAEVDSLADVPGLLRRVG